MSIEDHDPEQLHLWPPFYLRPRFEPAAQPDDDDLLAYTPPDDDDMFLITDAVPNILPTLDPPPDA
jgi:hypothetical protein